MHFAPYLRREFILVPESGRILFCEGQYGNHPAEWVARSDYRHEGVRRQHFFCRTLCSASSLT